MLALHVAQADIMNKLLGERSTQATKRAGPTAQTDHRAKRGRSAAHNGGESEASSEGSGTAFVPENVTYESAKTVVMGKELTYMFRRAQKLVQPSRWKSRKRSKAPNDNLLDGDNRYEWEYVRETGRPDGHILPGNNHVPEYKNEEQFCRDVADFLLDRKVSVGRNAIPRLSQRDRYCVESYNPGDVGRYIRLGVEKVPKGDPAYPYKGLFNRSGAKIAKGKPIGVYAGLLMKVKEFDQSWDRHPAGHMHDQYAWDVPEPDPADTLAREGYPDPDCGGALLLDAYLYRNDLAFANDCRIVSDGGEADRFRQENTAALTVRAPLRSIACASHFFTAHSAVFDGPCSHSLHGSPFLLRLLPRGRYSWMGCP